MENEKQKTEPKKLTPHNITQLDKLGARLPIQRQTADKKSYIKEDTFSFIEWDMDTEEQISEIKKKADNVGLFVNKMMGLLLDQFCGQDMQSMDDSAKTVLLSQLEFPNLMYMYIWLRVDELGPDYNVGDITCPVCRKVNPDFMGDLNTLEVRTKCEEDNEREVNYELKKPIQIGDELITGIMLNVSKWSVLEQAGIKDAENDGRMKRLMLKSAIAGALNAKGPITGFVDTETLLKKLKKVDIEKSMKAVTDNNAGPVMGVAGNCTHCDAEFIKQIDWRYDHFFDSSSL